MLIVFIIITFKLNDQNEKKCIWWFQIQLWGHIFGLESSLNKYNNGVRLLLEGTYMLHCYVSANFSKYKIKPRTLIYFPCTCMFHRGLHYIVRTTMRRRGSQSWFTNSSITPFGVSFNFVRTGWQQTICNKNT